jgi:superoxide reductase
MNNRRSFIKTSLVVAGGLAVSKSVFAAKKSKAIASGLIYKAGDAGMWSEKVGSHAPRVEVEGNMVGIKTEHGMSERHYIVRHTLVSENGEVIGTETFYPEDEEAISTYELPEGAKGKYFATSFCNKHDFWVTEFEI